MANCRKCSIGLTVTNSNPASSRHRDYICYECLKTYRKKNRTQLAKNCKDWFVQERLKTLQAYGNKCEICGENTLEFLAIDHKNGGGKVHRESLGSGHGIFTYLRKQNYPKNNYRLLCHNCNFLTGVTKLSSNPSKRVIRDRVLKQIVIDAYGGKCTCCEETRFELMTIDHISNDGAEDRLLLGKSKSNGRGLYYHLIKSNFPKDKYQLLCANCNLAKGYYKQCPHTVNKEKN